MSAKKQIKLKVKKRKIKIKRIIFCLVTLLVIILVCYISLKIPVKNIYVVGNNYVSDKEIITLSGLNDYPSFLRISKRKIINNLKENIYIKDVRIEKKLPSKIFIYVEEKKIICIYDGKILFEDGETSNNNYNILDYPILVSNIDAVKDRFISKFSLIDNDILLKISEIEYVPNDVDEERFALKMNDGNLVYVTLSKIEKMNKYSSIYSSLDGKKGIIYLDSGDYVEVKE